MPASKPRSSSLRSQTQEPYLINPYCAAQMATIAERLNQATQSLERTTETVFGNGKVGLKDQTEENTRMITEMTAGIRAITATHAEEIRLHTEKLEDEAKKQKEIDKERRKNIWQWRIAICVALIAAIGSIIVAIIGSDQIMALILRTH